MTKRERLLISIGAVIGGSLLCGFAMNTTLGDPISTICIVLGIGVAVSGFISLILAVKK